MDEIKKVVCWVTNPNTIRIVDNRILDRPDTQTHTHIGLPKQKPRRRIRTYIQPWMKMTR